MDKTGTFGDKLKISGRHVGANFIDKHKLKSDRDWKDALGFKRLSKPTENLYKPFKKNIK